MASKTTSKAPARGRAVTLKHLAAALAEEHEMTKRAGEGLLGDMVVMIRKHLKKGERIRISGFGILQVKSAPHAWGATRRPAKRSRSRRARRSPSGRPKSSSWR